MESATVVECGGRDCMVQLVSGKESLFDVWDFNQRGTMAGISADHLIILQQVQGMLAVIIEDDAIPFNPLKAPKPRLDVSLEEREIGDLNIHLVRKFLTG